MPEIGATLREARMRARIDISEVERDTKIRAKYLRALENEEWSLLPGSTFVRSFLRTYADYLGLDSKLLIEEFKLRHTDPGELEHLPPIAGQLGPERRRRLPAPRVSRGWIVGLAVLALLVLLAILGSIGGGSSKKSPSANKPARPLHRPAPAAASPKPAATTVRLKLVPQAPVYVCVRDAGGKQLLSQTISPGQGRSFRSKRLRVTVGNSSVLLRVDGRNHAVPPSATATNYLITPTATRTLPQGQGAC